MTSVNTNASAMTALRTLQATNKALDATQNRVSTGLKIGEAKDNAAYWAISTTLKSDNKSLSTVKDALNLGAATVDVAYQGLNKAKDVLDEIQKKLTAATAAGVDKDVIQSEIVELQKQLVSIASSSTFSGESWLSVDSSVPNYNSLKEVVASFSRDANNAVSIGRIGVDISKVALFDGNADTAKSGLLDAKVSLKDGSGRDLNFGGTALDGNTLAGGLEAGTSAGTDAVKAKSSFAGGFVAADIDANDTAVLTYKVDGLSASQTVTLSATDVKGSAFATQGRISTVEELTKAMNNAIAREGKSDVVAINDNGKLALQRTEGGVNKAVEIVSFAGATGSFTRNAVITNAAADIQGVGASVYEEQTVQITSALGAGGGGTINVTPGGGTLVTTAALANSASAVDIADAIVTAFAGNADVTVTKTATDTLKFVYKAYGNKADVTIAVNTATAVGTLHGVVATPVVGSTATPASSTANWTPSTTTTFGDANDTLLFKFTDDAVSGTQTVAVKLEDLVAAGITDSKIDSDQDMVDALQKAFIREGRTNYAVTLSASNVIKLASTTSTLGQDISIVTTNGADTLNVDVAAANSLGYEQASTTGIKRGTDAVAASVKSTGTVPAGGMTLDADDSLYFDVKVGSAATSTMVTIDKALVNSTLATATKAKVTLGAFDASGLLFANTIDVTVEWDGVASTYQITGLTKDSTAEEFAAKLNGSTVTSGGGVGASFTTKGNVTVENGRLVVSSTNAGASNSVKVTNVVNSNAFAGSGGLIPSEVAIGTDAKADAAGKISNNREMALVVQAALDKAKVAGVTVGLDGSNLSFSSSATGAAGKVEISKVQASSGANEISVDKIDISATGLAGVNAKSADEIKQTLSAYISVVKAAITKVTSAAANLGAAASRIDLQNTFVDTLMDTIDKGIGNLIDADLSEESTRLQALQTKQQLGVQALSIANSGTQQILRLFQTN